MKGFTLIELTVVLSIMAILASMMLPRFLHLQRAARIGNLQGLRGSVVAASTLAHAVLLARGGQRDAFACAGGGRADNQAVGAGTVCTEGGLVHTWNGYPASTPIGKPGIASAAGLGTVFNPTQEQLRAEGYFMSVAGPVTTFTRIDARDPVHCSFTYTQALDARTAAAISVPVTSGC